MGYGILELHIWILHRLGKHNFNADALSRAPLEQSKLHKSQKQQEKKYVQHPGPPTFTAGVSCSI